MALVPIIVKLVVGILCGPLCTCVPGPDDVTEAVRLSLESADVVFIAEVDSVTFRADSVFIEDGRYFPMDLRVAWISVIEQWKGNVTDETVVYTALYSTRCGADLQQGLQYLIYASADPTGMLHTSKCERTSEVSMAGPDLAVLRTLGAGGPYE